MRNIIQHAACGIASIVITAGLVAASAPAAASLPADAPRAVVRIGDLDLATATGRATAERRIRSASDHVCDGAVNTIAEAQCRNLARAGAMQALDAQAGTTVLAAR